MKNVLVLGVAALALVGCANKEEAPAPAAEAAAPAAEAAPAADAAPAVEVTGGPTSSEPAKEPNVVVPAK